MASNESRSDNSNHDVPLAVAAAVGETTGIVENHQDEHQESYAVLGVDEPSSVATTSPVLDPSLFHLSPNEKELALEIRETIQGLPDVDNVSDFMAAHLAIACKGDMTWAMDRVYKMRDIRKEYKIALTYPEGAKTIQDMFALAPDLLLSYQYNLHTGDVVLVMDMTSQYAKEAFSNPKSMNIVGRGVHYLCHAMFPCFEAVRVGNVHILECEGFDWGKGMVDVAQFGKLTNISHGAFPSVLRTKFFNTPTVLNVLVSMCKRYIPKEISSQFELGCTFVGGRLDKFYRVPNREVALKRAVDMLCESLQIRMESEKVFSLDDD
ncbi:expressed unknown protein [Seminavis robusta]|uniref:Uncharacterized protein n=1 Tax=Seminavis robusta TaxID=568900 RepID=A0A9N8HBN2_9STRA|nr:expressed unknown protein [Seminavis robusta]|eukprot:Sro284_g107880.1 n/a (322) ;mRNA; r:15605-16684